VTLKDLIAGARPRTLGAAVTPVMVGTFCVPQGTLARFSACLIVALGLQIGVNFVNDAADGAKGIDTNRVGPMRLVASGRATAKQVWFAASVSIVIAAGAGLWLALVVGMELLLVGALAIVALLAYSAGPKPYASLGFGEVLVFICFGLLATVGTAYVQAEQIVVSSIWVSVPVGLAAVLIMLTNNVRDIETDQAASKRTLAVRLGHARATALFKTVLLLIPASILLAVLLDQIPTPCLLALAAMPLAAGPWRTISSHDPIELISALKQCAMLQLQMGLGLVLGFVFA
jgi:1,4-dihydroxy-2-naphthoate polyprenyltransferase